MKTGLIAALALAVGWAGLAIAQLWLSLMPGEHFIKITITAGILIGIILLVTLAIRDYLAERKMKDDGYLDG